MLYFVCFLLLVEAYYWFYWLPRHWREVPDARNIVFAYKELYGSGQHNTYKTIKRYKIANSSTKIRTRS